MALPAIAWTATGRLVRLGHPRDGAVRERLGRAGERAVVVERVRMVNRQQQLVVEAVHGPAVPVQDIGDGLPVADTRDPLFPLKIHGYEHIFVRRTPGSRP
jgi:hypothetical protein